ncbi:MAG TPA: hypothetical protein VFW87_21315, partial [Pirellulales bacterium]|nr:hypothetical protein [Pirellulales bacterium]
MQIFARRALAASLLRDTATFSGSPGPCGRLSGDTTRRARRPGLPAGEATLLLEGSWAGGGRSSNCWSLDDAIDARFAWIDRSAAECAERLARQESDPRDDDHPTLAYINELALRYFLVKLLRVVAFFDEVCVLVPGEAWQLDLCGEADTVYAELFGALAERHGVELTVHWHGSPGPRGRPSEGSTGRAQGPGLPFAERKATLPWRRWLARAASAISRTSLPSKDDRPRVILCGNPRVLDPVCAELLSRGCRVWWLYEQFAVRAWWKWRRAGITQLLCDNAGSLNAKTDQNAGVCNAGVNNIVCRGVRLGGAIANWLSEKAATHGDRQFGWLEQIGRHFRAVQPTALVLDEDATPLKRVAVAMGRRHGARSLVVQHGAPCGPFGFAPLTADEICVWGESTREQLLHWGINDARIHVSGWPAPSAHRAGSLSARSGAALIRSSPNATDGVSYRRRWTIAPVKLDSSPPSRPARAPRFLLLATVPPDDARPDTATFHLTGRNHAAMIAMACAAVSRFAGARLTIKLHPRTRDAGVFESLAKCWPQLDIRLVHNRDAAALFADADCVLSCASTAGIEAALGGAPVVQLLPEGSGEVLPAARWGLIGSARTPEELPLLIDQALARGWLAAPQRWPDIVAETGSRAAAAIAERVLSSRFSPVAGAEA